MGPEQTPPQEPESTGDDIADKIIEHSAERAKRIVGEEQDPESTASMIPEEARQHLEKERAIYEADLAEYRRLLDIEQDKAPSNALAIKNLENRGIFPPEEPPDPQEVQLGEDAEAREEAQKMKEGVPDKPRREPPPRYLSPRDKGAPPEIAKEIREGHDAIDMPRREAAEKTTHRLDEHRDESIDDVN